MPVLHQLNNFLSLLYWKNIMLSQSVSDCLLALWLFCSCLESKKKRKKGEWGLGKGNFLLYYLQV